MIHAASMLDGGGSVVPETSEPTEAEFRAAMLAGLSRCSNTTAGKRALASKMDLSTKGLDNILLKGAMPGPKRLWDATGACGHVMTEIAALYGYEMVRKSDGEAVSLGTVPIASLLAQVAEAEAPTSDGGAKKTHTELLAMEASIRAVHAITAEWINQITTIRSPRAVRA